MRKLILPVFLLLSIIVKSQDTLQLCSTYSDEIFSGCYNNWSIEKSGNHIYLVYQSDKPILDSIIINIYKNYSRKDSNYYYYDYYYLLPDKANNKVAYNKYAFSSPGNYKISTFENKTENFLTSTFSTIVFKNSEYINYNFTDTWYYSDTKVAFCDSLAADGTLIGRNTVFAKKEGGNAITLYLEQSEEKSLNTDHLYIKVFKVEESCTKLVDVFTSEIGRDWFWTTIKFFLKDSGKYNIELYTQDDILINTGSIEIN